MNPREEVMSALAAAARRLRLTRMAEAAGVGAAAGGLCATALAVAWALARTSPLAGIALCAAMPALGLLSFRKPIRDRLRVSRNLAFGVTLSLVAASAAAAITIALGACTAFPLPAMVACVIALGAAGGAAGAAAGGVSAVQAGVYHDIELHLKERLVTAAELDATGASGPVADHVYRQAAAAVRSARPQHRPVWRRTRATAGAALLSAVLAVAAAILLQRPAESPAAALRALADNAPQLTPNQRQDLTAALQRLAEEVRNNPALRDALRAAAAAAEKGEPEDLQRKLDQAGDALLAAEQAEAARIAREILSAAGVSHKGQSPPANHDANRPANGQALQPATGGATGPDKPLASRAVVWHPDYARLMKDHAGGATGAQTAPAAGPVAFGDAWSAARGQAARALAGGTLAPEYRPIVRKFFQLDNDANR